MTVERPYDGQLCLTKMKHGLISGRYCADGAWFGDYYWRDMEWGASHWVPLEEVDP
jgi:hypothetical protein